MLLVVELQKMYYVHIDRVDCVKAIDTGGYMEDHHYTNGKQPL